MADRTAGERIAAETAAALARPGRARRRHPGPVRRRGARARRLSRPQHAGQSAAGRTSRPGSAFSTARPGSASARPDPVFAGRHLCPRLSGRADQHALCRGARHRAGDRARHASWGWRGCRANWLVAKLAQIYVETFRNIPLALQLFFWWGLLRGYAPAPRQAWQPLPDVFVSNRGLVFPLPHGDPAYWWMLAAFAVGIAGAWGLARWARRRQARTGRAVSGRLGRPRPDPRPAGDRVPVLFSGRIAAASRCAGAARVQLRRRRRRLARIRRAAARSRDLHRRVYRRDRARRHSRGQLGAERGGDGARADDRRSACGWSCCRRRCASSCRR